jgi:hypothetical protein
VHEDTLRVSDAACMACPMPPAGPHRDCVLLPACQVTSRFLRRASARPHRRRHRGGCRSCSPGHNISTREAPPQPGGWLRPARLRSSRSRTPVRSNAKSLAGTCFAFTAPTTATSNAGPRPTARPRAVSDHLQKCRRRLGLPLRQEESVGADLLGPARSRRTRRPRRAANLARGRRAPAGTARGNSQLCLPRSRGADAERAACYTRTREQRDPRRASACSRTSPSAIDDQQAGQQSSRMVVDRGHVQLGGADRLVPACHEAVGQGADDSR